MVLRHNYQFEKFSETYNPDQRAIEVIPKNIAHSHNILPLFIRDNTLFVATLDDNKTIEVADLVQSISDWPVQVMLVDKPKLKEFLAKAYPRTLLPADQVTDRESPIDKRVHEIFLTAYKNRATDIHFEPNPQGRGGRVRFRIDGVMTQPHEIDDYRRLVSKIKTEANMDPSNQLEPQDGRIVLQVGDRRVDMRVASQPATPERNVEKLVCRLLGHFTQTKTLAELGMDSLMAQRYLEAVAQESGFVLVTGPTGSGKTTTLYSTFREIQDELRSLVAVSIEDPIEMELDGVVQSAVNAKIELTFPALLRSALRQDPDIIMVGEIRDRETAETALNAALTGHLILSTIHSSDSIRTINRLADLGVSRLTLSSALTTVVGQRLLRRLCLACRVECKTLPRAVARQYPEFHGMCYTAGGFGPDKQRCQLCNGTGFFRQIAVYEVLPINDKMRELIAAQASVVDLARTAEQSTEFQPLFRDAVRRVMTGDTSWEEVRRAVTIEDQFNV